MEHSGVPYIASAEGIRQCRPDDFEAVGEIWSREYADMHRRLGLPFERHEETEEICGGQPGNGRRQKLIVDP